MMDNMFNSNKLMDRFFKRVDNVVWDLMSGKVGIQTADGIVTVEGEGDDAQPVLNLFDQFGMPVPAFAQNTPSAAVNVGDLIYSAKGTTGWVVEKLPKGFKILKADGTRTSFIPPKVAMLGFDSGVMVLRSLMNMLPGGSSGLQGIQSMLLPMMMMGGDDMNIESMMPMILMSQMGAGVTAADGTTAPAMGGMAQMLPMMMMMNMMKGGSKTGGKPGMFGKSGPNFFDNN
jgi:hypothetical protein